MPFSLHLYVCCHSQVKFVRHYFTTSAVLMPTGGAEGDKAQTGLGHQGVATLWLTSLYPNWKPKHEISDKIDMTVDGIIVVSGEHAIPHAPV